MRFDQRTRLARPASGVRIAVNRRTIVQTLAMTTVEVLVSVQTNDGLAGVLRDEDGAMWLSWRTDSLGGPRLDGYRPHHLSLPDDRTLIGGRLPPGAVGSRGGG
jgi:hypothetical protein